MHHGSTEVTETTRKRLRCTDPPHHYQITVYALGQALKLEPGVDEDTLIGAMKGHLLGQGRLVGTVQKK